MKSNQKFAASERRALEPLTGEENDAVLALLSRARTLLEVQRLELIQSQMAIKVTAMEKFYRKLYSLPLDGTVQPSAFRC